MAVISRSTSVRLLVIRLSAMGDVAMVAPVLVALRRNYPNLRITVLTPKFLQPFFREVGNIEFFAPDLKGRHKGVAGLLRLGRDLGRFDMVADLHDVLRSKGLCRLMKLRGTRIERIDKGRAEKKMLTAPENKQRVQLKTTVERYREVFVRLGFDLPEIPLPSRIRYPMSEAVARLAGAHDGTWIGVSPFAQHEGKIYPLDKMREVMLRLARIPGARIFVFGGGDAEKAYAEEVAALRDNIVSVWGATHPFAGFYGFGQDPALAVQVDMPCRPCSVYGNKPCLFGDYRCMRQITPGMIVSRVCGRLGVEIPSGNAD